jgi:hypothetical protein
MPITTTIIIKTDCKEGPYRARVSYTIKKLTNCNLTQLNRVNTLNLTVSAY